MSSKHSFIHHLSYWFVAPTNMLISCWCFAFSCVIISWEVLTTSLIDSSITGSNLWVPVSFERIFLNSCANWLLKRIQSRQPAFLRVPAFQAGCQETTFHLLPFIVLVITLSDRSDPIRNGYGWWVIRESPYPGCLLRKKNATDGTVVKESRRPSGRRCTTSAPFDTPPICPRESNTGAWSALSGECVVHWPLRRRCRYDTLLISK